MLRQIQNKLGVNQTGVFDKQMAKAMMYFLQLKPIEAAHYLGQLAHESGGFRHFEENLNYSAQRLAEVWPHRFAIDRTARLLRPNQLALRIAGNPVEIGNTVYGGRMGNVNPNDGFNFRGRGKPHLTGRSNYQCFSDWLKVPAIMSNPDLVAKEYAMESGIYYFEKNEIFRMCFDLSDQTILNISRRINIGRVNTSLIPNGLEDRRNKTLQIAQWLNS